MFRSLRWSAAASLAAVFLALSVHAEDPPADPEEAELPMNPFAHAAVGDWETMIFQREAPGHPRISAISTWRVTKVEETTVSVNMELLNPGDKTPTITPRTFYKADKIAIRDFFLMKPDVKVSAGTVTDRKLTLGGHVFDGKQLAFECEGGFVNGKTLMIFCSDVKGAGIVATETTTKENWLTQEQVEGYGTKGKTLWGRTAEEVTVVEEKDGAPEPGLNFYTDKNYGFSILPPRVGEVQDRQIARAFTYQGPAASLSVLVRGSTLDRKAFHDEAVQEIKDGKFKIKSEEERTVGAREALLLEYEGDVEIPGTKIKESVHVLDLIVFLEGHVVSVRASSPARSFAAQEKALRAALKGVRQVEVGRSDHKGELPGGYVDHQYGLSLSLPDVTKIKAGETLTVVDFAAPEEAHGLTTHAGVTVLQKAVLKKDWKPEEIAGFKVVSTKDKKVSGRDAVLVERQGTMLEKEMHTLSLVVFDKARLYTVNASATKASWTEGGQESLRASLDSFKLD